MANDHYDPLQAPDAVGWLDTEEGERITLALDFHSRARAELPNARLHATLHVIVENQVALGDETPVQVKVRQLMAQGLDRHEAIHAIASVLIKYLSDLTQNGPPNDDTHRRYYSALRRLNARTWLRSG